MNNEMSRVIDKKFRAAVACLEMEISDSVMEDLLAAIANHIQEDSDDSAASLLLLAMDSVVRYVDALRVRSNPVAFILIDELWQAYERILTGKQGEKERQEFALGKMKKVLDWQHRCLVDGAGEQPVNKVAGNNLPPAVAELVQQEIVETGSLIQQELAALKQVAGAVSAANSRRADLEQHVSSAIVDQFSSLQEIMDQEISKLRQELQLGSGQA
jgi:hypothetical protein